MWLASDADFTNLDAVIFAMGTLRFDFHAFFAHVETKVKGVCACLGVALNGDGVRVFDNVTRKPGVCGEVTIDRVMVTMEAIA